jgi:glycosyltransferase involved in cell wall biosynthesis
MSRAVDRVPGQTTTARSIAIAAEPIGECGGLDNYLSCLAPALQRHLNEGQALTVMRRQAAGASSSVPTGRLRVMVTEWLGEGLALQLLRRVYQVVARPSLFPDAPAWVAAWQGMAPDTVCVIPHVVCNDDGALDDYYAILAARAPVWIVHDLHPLHFPDQWRPRAVRTFQKRCSLLATSAARIIVHNEYTKRDVVDRLGVESGRIAVAHLPSILPDVDSQTLPSADDTLKQLGVARPYALWASTSTLAHKNHDRLLKAWRLLGERGNDLRLVCTGWREPRWKEVAALIEQLGLSGTVTFTGIVSRENLRVLIENARVAVCPTLFEGGGCGPAVEAIGSRIPVACSRIPQIQEQLGSRDDLCEWFDPTSPEAIATAVEKVLADYQAAMRRAELAQTVFPTLRSWDDVATAYLDAINTAAAVASPRQA